ncbi:methyltransferase domain-containing protein [Synechococcus sp. PCC 7336]|uniref:methyltransferase domain-containing protein n=1 Tax=Synechococcus sp. PCC 7336 TaxID=195250 RepID=UPI000348284C|nr:methyltransferase domain-containing protein [Synechococcus sp. PCC 7336]
MDWEQRYREGDTPWNRGEPSPGLADYLQAHSLAGDILVPGCGVGHDVREIAKYGGRVLGIDIAPTAIATAKTFPVTGNERYERADLFALPSDYSHRFNWVVEYTCFCALDRVLRSRYVEAIAAVLKPGGRLLAVFYINPDKTGDGPPHGIEPEQLDVLFSPHFQLLKDWQPQKAYPKQMGRERMRLLQRLPRAEKQ